MSGRTKRTLIALFLLAVVLLVTVQEAYAEDPKDLSKIAGWKGTDPKSAEAFSFVVVSDRTGGHVEGEWAAAVEEVNLLQPDFIICVGDLIEGYTEDKAELGRQWEELDTMTQKFSSPFFYCSGNHDVSNDTMLELYCQYHGVNGKSYYSFDYRGCHFVVLDSMTAIRKASFAEEQLAWLAKDLGKAKDSKHLFVFYHHPRFENERLFSQVRKLLPATKSTIFNGHYHSLSFKLADGIPQYVLSATGADVGEGGFRMFAQVSVNEGKPTVAIIPLHEILPPSYGQFITAAKSMFADRGVIREEDGMFTFKVENPLTVPISLEFRWEAQGWIVQPAGGKLEFEPGAMGKKDFTLAPEQGPANNPILLVSYRYMDPYRKRIVEVELKVVAICTALDIPRVEDTAVDGYLNDWSTVKPLRVADKNRICLGQENWVGQQDSSFDMWVATDGDRLFLALDVTDDQIDIDGKDPWINDGVEIFWDTRPLDKRDGKHGPGTGQVILAVPEKGVKPKPNWYQVQSKPKGLRSACKRREGGYVYELSIPLSELGVESPPRTGQNIWLVVMVDDRDLSEGKAAMTHMTTTGLGSNHGSTGGYAPWTFK